jgi:carbonic anhydrase
MKTLNIIIHRKSGNRRFPLLATVIFSATFLLYCACTETQRPKKCEEHSIWGYTGNTGPDYWGDLAPEYAIAKEGKSQSPININTLSLTVSDSAKPTIAYQAMLFKVENNGHTIKLIPATDNNYITLDGSNYTLQQFHFHTPGEHTINGQHRIMELHLVHGNAQGNLAVIGFMIVACKENEILKTVFAQLPDKVTCEINEGPEVTIDLTGLFVGQETMYRYKGSLTTPPCSEDVEWVVATKNIELSTNQIDAFRAIYRNNNRPVQALNGRAVCVVR